MSTPSAQFAINWLRENAPTPSDGHEAVALAVHAILLHYDFRPSNTETETARTTAQNSSNENNETTATAAPTTLPADWGGVGYGGQYRHVRSAMLFDIRAVRMGGRLLVHAVAGEDDTRLNTVDVRVGNFYNNQTANEQNDGDGESEADDPWARLRDMDGLATLVAVQIAHRLVPEGAKQGYEHGTPASTSTNDVNNNFNNVTPTPVPMPGPRPYPRPDYNDPLRVGPVRDPSFPILGQAPPLGHDDLLPAGLPRPGLGGGGMFGPGGNLMGPGHFQGGRDRRPPGVPPGARFDPYGVNPDPDAEILPGFDDDHRLRGGTGMRLPPRGGRGGGSGSGPPPGVFF